MSNIDNKIRKSNRQPVPNPIYQQGITQLKSENYPKPKKRGKNQNDLHYQSEGNSLLNYDSFNNNPDSKDQYLPCRMPDGSQMRVKFVFEPKNQEKKKQKEHYVPTPKPVSQNVVNKKSTNLLNLFIQAIDNVEGGDQLAEQASNIVRNVSQAAEKQKVGGKTKKEKMEDEDYLCNVKIDGRNMILSHSQLGQINYTVDWQETQMINQQSQQVRQLRKKLQGCKLLKSIPILNGKF